MESYETLPGQFKMIFYMLAGLTIGLPLLAIPKKALARIGKLPYLSPNWLSVWRLPLTWLGYALYFLVDPFIGFCILVFAFILDRIDGKVAVALDELKDPRYPGKTPTGEWLDPLIDKLTVPVPFIIFGYSGMLVWWLVAVMVLSEAIGTIMRDPFLNINKQPFIWIKEHVRKQGASGIGKTKIVVQFLCMMICLPIDRGWMDIPLIVPNIILGFSAALSILSVASRLKLNKKFQTTVDEVTDGFNHNE